MRASLSLAFAFAFAGSMPGFAQDDTLTLPIAGDTSLFELDPDFNMGTQTDLPSGTLGSMGQRRKSRVLFRVELADLPAGAVIRAARYRVQVTRVPSGRENATFSLHRVLVPWGEGEKRGEIPGGRMASDGEATWNARFHPDEKWSAPGGALGVDYAEGISAETFVSGTGEYVFEFNGQGLEDLAVMQSDPESNHGWALLSQAEDRAKTARRFAAREHDSRSPSLEIELEPADPGGDRWIPSITRGSTGDELLVTAPADPDGLYRLQTSASLDSISWQNAETPAEFIQGQVSFRVKFPERKGFYRIVAEPSGG